jgi:hypothetical protein
MKITEAIKILGIYQKWRLGADFQMIPPNKVTKAINVILNNFKELYTKQEFLDAAKLGEVNMIDAKYIVSLLDELREKNNK